MQVAQIPGMSVAVVEHGKVIYVEGFGVRELGKNDPVTPDTLLMIGSSTKPLTTLMMATVVDDGLMQWDTPATSILPAFAVGAAARTAQLKMRHLVCACSGIPGDDTPLFLSGLQTAEDLIQSMRAITPVAEIGEEYQTLFTTHGGQKVQLVPSCNDHPRFIDCLEKLVRERLHPARG